MKRHKKQMVTIYDIAKEAGVSPGTVSRTLNNIGYIKDETRKKIEEAAKRLKYTPNRAARTLKTKRTGLILLAIPDMDNTFYVDMIRAIQEVVKQNNYSLVLYYTEAKEEEELKALRMLHEHFADGMILINFYFNKTYIKEIERINFPLVLSSISKGSIGGGEGDKFDYIGVDVEKGIYLATKHLIQQGHTDIGYIGGLKDLEVFKERFQGYRNALIDSGLPFKEELVFWKDYTESSGYQAGERFMKMDKRPTAVCAANDMMAMGALRYFEENGLEVPRDISIIGMDNIEVTARLKPKMSSVAIAQWEIGRAAAELIFKRLNDKENGPSKKIIFEPRLVVRESSVVYTESSCID